MPGCGRLYGLACPVAHGAGLAAEGAADAVDGPGVLGVLAGIALFLDLADGLGGGPVELVLEDVDEARGLDDEVGAALAGVLLVVNGVDTHHAHEQVDGVLEVALLLSLVLMAACGVGNAGEERGEQVAVAVGVALLEGALGLQYPGLRIVYQN